MDPFAVGVPAKDTGAGVAPAGESKQLVPVETMRRHRVVPLAVTGGTLQLGVAGPLPAPLLRDLAFLTGKTVVPVAIDADELDDLLASCVPDPGASVDDVRPEDRRTEGGAGRSATGSSTATPGPDLSGEHESVRVTAPQGSVVQQIDRLIAAAIDRNASDIHVEPYETAYRVRYRLDGVLHTVAALSLLQRDALTARLKIMADLDIAEKRRPQDGRIRFRHGDRTVDLRVSSLPTDFGEKIVLRILDQEHLRLNLDALGFDAPALDSFHRAIRQPYGILLVSGPTGSGKTTTLYAALNALNTDAVNVTTIEDPIEYHLPGINQTHVRRDIGFTFAQALRAFLRQDPNVIMVGEIRDRETAEIAIRASLTGHLVLSTIHTNDAPSTVTRLVNMGVEPFLVASSLHVAVAQRLVRRICPDCKEPSAPDPAVCEALRLEAGGPLLFRGRGCTACNGTGYRGRTALFEVMPVSEALADLITRRATVYALRRQARADGVPSLRSAGLAKLRAGLTTPDEVLRETTL